MMKIYIAGSGGMLGEAFYMYFKDKYKVKCSDINVNEDWLSFLDFRDFQAYIKDVKETSLSSTDEDTLKKLKEKNLSPEDLKKIYEDLQKKK